MSDQENWQEGIRLMENIHGRLSCQLRPQLVELLDCYRRYKGEMVAFTCGSNELCHECGGQCCQNGKYRFRGLDLLALLDVQASFPVPDFSRKPLCPYGDSDGCTLEPSLRPLDCVLFICAAIEERLSGTTIHALALLEQQLRQSVQQAELLLEQPVGRPLLLLAGRSGGSQS